MPKEQLTKTVCDEYGYFVAVIVVDITKASHT